MSENYLASIGEVELERLELQHQTWKYKTDSFLGKAGFSSFKKIVEFGCGPGFAACDLAQHISPQAEVCGIDISDKYLQYLNDYIKKNEILNLTTLKANLAHPVDIGSKFDGAFCRWFLGWIARDMDSVLKNIFNSLKPGGVFASMENLTLRSTVSSPPCSVLDHLVWAWEKFYAQCGGNSEVGLILPDALVRTGFNIKEIECVSGVGRNGDPIYNWWKRMHEDFGHVFREKNLLSIEQESELKQYWNDNAANPNSFVHSPILIQITAIKP